MLTHSSLQGDTEIKRAGEKIVHELGKKIVMIALLKAAASVIKAISM